MKGSNPSFQTCRFCIKNPSMYLYSNSFTHRMEIDSVNHVVSLWRGSEWVADFPTEFCPVCGRKFREDNPSRD